MTPKSRSLPVIRLRRWCWRIAARLSSVPFVGTVPAIKPAAERDLIGSDVSVLATPGYGERALPARPRSSAFASRCHVRLVGADGLAAIAEAHIRGESFDEALVMAQIAPCFIEKRWQAHRYRGACLYAYPFLVNVLRRLAPWPVDWLDPAEAIARRMKSLLPARSDDDEFHSQDDLAFFTSRKPDYAIRRLMQGFGPCFNRFSRLWRRLSASDCILWENPE